MAEGSGTTAVRYDLAHYGKVTAVTSPTVFTIATLAGFGDGVFAGATAPYSVFVLRSNLGLGGAPQGENQLVTGYVSRTGVFTIAGGFTVPIALNDEVLVIHPTIANGIGGWAALLVIANAIRVQTDKTAGMVPVVGTTVANWGAAAADLITLGADNVRYKVHSLIVQIFGMVGIITIRLFTQVNGVERQVWPVPLATTFTVAADGPAIPVINGTWGIHEALRVTVQSSNVADNGVAVAYDAMLEEM
jgi:hypothetical protein